METPTQELALKPEELDRLELLAKAATPGPWSRLHDGRPQPAPLSGVVVSASHCDCGQVWSAEVDWPVAYCDTTELGEGPSGDARMANAAHIAAFDPPTALRLIAQARTPVPPAAAPVGEFREVLQLISEQLLTSEMTEDERDAADIEGGYDLIIFDARAALSAAPIAGDREQNPYDIVGALMGDWECYKELDHHMQVRLHRDLGENLGLNPPSNVAGDRETAGVEPAFWTLQDGFGRTLPDWSHKERSTVEAWVANRSDREWKVVPVYLATPPSGGGDHAGGEGPEAAQRRHEDYIDSTFARATAAPASGVKAVVDAWWQAQLDVDDRTSPVEYPDMILVTREEADQLAACAALAASPKAQGSDVGLREALSAIEKWAEQNRDRAYVGTPGGNARHEAFDEVVQHVCLAASRTGQTGAGS